MKRKQFIVYSVILCFAIGAAMASILSDNFTKVPNAAISGYNDKHLTGVSPEDCAKQCIKETSFYCKSFDYYKNDRACDLSSKSADDVGGLKTNYGGNPYDHYARGAASMLDKFIRTSNAAISGHNNKHLTDVSPEDCARECLNESSFYCKSFDYYKNERACDLSSENADDVGGLKTNYGGNPYDHYARKEATSMLKKFSLTRNAAISGYNDKHLTGVSPEDCAKQCVQETSFHCKSFDYYKNDRACDLSSKNANDVGGLKTNYSGNPYDHYSRN